MGCKSAAPGPAGVAPPPPPPPPLPPSSLAKSNYVKKTLKIRYSHQW